MRRTTVLIKEHIWRIYKKSRYTYRDAIEWFARELMKHDKDFIEAEKRRLLIRQLELEEKKNYHEIQVKKIEAEIQELDIQIRRLDKMLEKEHIPYEIKENVKKALRIVKNRMKVTDYIFSPFELEAGNGQPLIEYLSREYNIPKEHLVEAIKDEFRAET